MNGVSPDLIGLGIQTVMIIVAAALAFAKLKSLIDQLGNAVGSLNISVNRLTVSLEKVQETQSAQAADIAVLKERTARSNQSTSMGAQLK